MDDTNTTSHLLVIDGESSLVDALSRHLVKRPYTLTYARTAEEGLKQARQKDFDLILLDVASHKFNGLEVLEKVRYSHLTPVILLIESNEEFEAIYGMRLGADDYVSKPVMLKELVSRINKQLTRGQDLSRHRVRPQIKMGSIVLDTNKHVISIKNTLLNLTQTEFKIMESLIINKGLAVSKDDISNLVFKRPLMAHDRSIDMHISNLRKKLECVQPKTLLRTCRGTGYMIIPSA